MAQNIDAITNMMWPLLVLLVLLMFRRPVTSVIDSAKQREFTVKVGGQEIDMKELSQQQDKMIADLQGQLGRLQQHVGMSQTGATPTEAEPSEHDAVDLDGPSAPTTTPTTAPAEVPVASAVLWVDDHPEENALIIDRLERNGIRVDTVESTDDGVRMLNQRRYGAVISDMVRNEAGAQVSDAGLRMLTAVRHHDTKLPFLIYSNAPEAQTERAQALAGGAALVSSSAVSLVSTLDELGLPAT